MDTTYVWKLHTIISIYLKTRHEYVCSNGKTSYYTLEERETGIQKALLMKKVTGRKLRPNPIAACRVC